MDADTPATSAACPCLMAFPRVTHVFILIFPRLIWLRLTRSSVCRAFGSCRRQSRTMFAFLSLNRKSFRERLDRRQSSLHFVATRFVSCRVRNRRMILRFPLNHSYKAYYEQAS